MAFPHDREPPVLGRTGGVTPVPLFTVPTYPQHMIPCVLKIALVTGPVPAG